jgi:hypothetical protein
MESLANMARKAGHHCGCPLCLEGREHPAKDDHQQLNSILDRLDEQQRRWVAGREAIQLGHGGITTIARITGLHHETVRRGKNEIQSGFDNRPTNRIRLAGGGRPRAEKKIPR